MPFSPADFEKGIDFTALGPGASAGSHNTLVDNASPYTDIPTQSGKSIILWSVDIALGIADVPDASTTTKWKQYIWMRVPNFLAGSQLPVLYVWNEFVASDPTYRKWVVFNDLTALTALITALDTRVDNVEISVNNVLTTANAANALAAQALAAAQAALTAAQEANVNAEEALNLAQGALTTAGNALTAANNAATVAATAKTTADSALANEAANRASRYRTGTIATAIAAGRFTGDIAHGFASTPDVVEWRLICTTVNLGYALNDEVPITSITSEDGGDADYDLPVFVPGQDANYIWLTYNSVIGAQVKLLNKTTGVPTAWNSANWKVKAIAIKWPS